MEHYMEIGEDASQQSLSTAYLERLVTEEDAMLEDPHLLQPLSDAHSYIRGHRKTKAGLLPDKPYMCRICNTPFTNSSNLKAHERTHTGEKPYVCEICNLAFVQSSNLKAHLRTHTGERPYVCDICGQNFSRSSHLTGHKRTHTGEKPYICGTCGETFATSTHLRNHVRKHSSITPYTCNICEVSFQQNAQLKNHMKAHNGDRPYKCCDCAGAFRSKGDLRSHRKLHADDRPFICGKCGKTFKTFPYLNKHLAKCASPETATEQENTAVVDVVSIKDEPIDLDAFELIGQKGEIISLRSLLVNVGEIRFGEIENSEGTNHIVTVKEQE